MNLLISERMYVLTDTERTKNTSLMPGADKAVKCREDGVTRYVTGYTVFFLCGELFWYL